MIKEEIVSKIQALPTLPAVALKILDLILDDNANFQVAGKMVEADQALSLKVLKIVNSPFYGLPQEIPNITQAISMLGFETLKSIVLSVSIFDNEILFDSHTAGFHKPTFWKHSLAVAAAASSIARDINYPAPEEAYAVGLFHDMGKVVLDMQNPEAFSEVMKKVEEKPENMLNIEREILGTDHAEVGLWAAEKWHLPLTMRWSIAYHHKMPDTFEPDSRVKVLINLITFCDFLAWVHGLGSIKSKIPPIASPDYDVGVKITTKMADRALSSIDEELKKCARLFHFKAPDLHAFRKSLQQANIELGKINMQYMEAKQELEYKVKQLLNLTDSMREIQKKLGEQEVIEAIMHILKQRFQYDKVVYWKIDRTNAIIRASYITQNEIITQENNVFVSSIAEKSLLHRCINAKNSFYESLNSESASDPVFKLMGGNIISFYPVIIGNEVEGVITCSNTGVNKMVGMNIDIISIFVVDAGLALEKVRLYRETLRLSVTDPLTKVANRRKLDEILAYEVNRTKRYGSPLSLCVFDIDYFKKLNDKYGHDAGDVILKAVAQILVKAGRTTDFVARLGGEEFVTILPETNGTSAMVYGERVRASVELFGQKYKANMPKYTLTISGGIAQFNPNSDDAALLIKKADKALYEAKDSGRNKIILAPD